MIAKQPLVKDRVRKIATSFAWVSHQFIRQGFWSSLSHHELLLYLFLVIVGDRQGLSYYSFDKLCSLLAISTEEYIDARNALITKDLIAFDGHVFQVLSLPDSPVLKGSTPITRPDEMEQLDPATVHQIVSRQFGSRSGSSQ